MRQKPHLFFTPIIIIKFAPQKFKGKMGLHCGIIGIANCGKTTVFNCMSKTKAETSNFAFSSNKSNIGVISVPDARLKEMEKFQPTEKLVPATVDIVDIPGLTKGSNHGEGVGNQFLADIRNADALIHVLRCFDDDNLPSRSSADIGATLISSAEIPFSLRKLTINLFF